MLLFFVSFAVAQSKMPQQNYPLTHSSNWVESKNYYLLYLFQQDKEVNKLLAADAALSKLLHHKQNAIRASVQNCKEANCFIDSMKFSNNEIKMVGQRLIQLYKTGNALDRLTTTQLIPSGTYNLYAKLPPSELLVKAWEQDASAVNYAIDVYGGGKAPNYPKIDSIAFNVGNKNYPILMFDFASVLTEGSKSSALFFEPSLDAALLFLQINNRENAADYEPMQSTVNHAAFMHIKSVNWKQYPYATILVPGAGPEDAATALSAEGMLRCKLAVQQYQKGAAPFIMVSGGKVHPYKTKFCEAEEMKKYLMDDLHIPENVIIMEPHARHTTTNLRNAARLIHQYGIPFDKADLIITDKSQNDFIVGMADRCLKELSYVPYKLGKRLSDTQLEFYPKIESLQIDADEPMDP